MIKMPPEMIEQAEADKQLTGWYEKNRLPHLPEDVQEQYFNSKEINRENIQNERK